MSVTQEQQLGDLAIGTIEPAPRIASGEITEARVDELAERLKGNEFFSPIGELGPNSSGGTLSLVVADSLTTNRFRAKNQSAAGHAESLYSFIQENMDDEAGRKIIPRVCVDGRPAAVGSEANDGVIGVHDADHAEGENCGCAAADKLNDHYGYISKHGDKIRGLLEGIGVAVSDQAHQTITSNATELHDSSYASTGKGLRQAAVNVAGEPSVTTLVGPHGEVAVSINTQENQTLDRAKVKAEFGSAYQLFNVDTAPLQKAAEAISLTEEEANQKFIAMLYYNVAVAAVLSGPSLRVVVR